MSGDAVSVAIVASRPCQVLLLAVLCLMLGQTAACAEVVQTGQATSGTHHDAGGDGRCAPAGSAAARASTPVDPNAPRPPQETLPVVEPAGTSWRGCDARRAPGRAGRQLLGWIGVLRT